MRLSLQNQLSLWAGLTIVIIVFSVVYITQQTTAWSLNNTFDENIKKRAYMVASVISSDLTTDEESYVTVISNLADQKLSFVSSQLRVINPAGETILQYGEISSPVIQQLDLHLQETEVSTGYFSTVTGEKNEHFRTFTISVPHARTHGTLAYVQIIESLRFVEQSMGNLWFNGLIIGIGGSLIATAIGYFLIRRGLRPLNRIVGAIDRIDYDHLQPDMKEAGPTELEQLSRSLSAMAKRLDLAVSEKRKIIGSMSHDLRTPLTALQGQLEVMLEQPSLPPGNRDSLERMLKETGRLTRMVKNLLLSVQLESKPSVFMDRINLKDIVDEVIADIWPLTAGLEFNIAADNDITVMGNRDLLVQLLMNITDNAIKFTPKGGKIDLIMVSDYESAILRVSDNGPGIAEKQLPYVMQPFHKMGHGKVSGQGAHLGLSIVKQIVDLHHGNIEIKSAERSGTSVIIRLPLIPVIP